MMKTRGIPSIVCCLLLSFALAGCDSSPPTAPVTGKVTMKGAPVSTGTVKFYPKQGGRAAVGQIQSDGTYELSRREPGDNVELGEYVVTIEAKEVKAGSASEHKSLLDEANSESSPSAGGGVVWLVPQEYSMEDTSGLTATVEDKNNQIDFDLK